MVGSNIPWNEQRNHREETAAGSVRINAGAARNIFHRHVHHGEEEECARRVPREISTNVRPILSILATSSIRQFPVHSAKIPRNLRGNVFTAVGEHSLLGEATGLRHQRR